MMDEKTCLEIEKILGVDSGDFCIEEDKSKLIVIDFYSNFDYLLKYKNNNDVRILRVVDLNNLSNSEFQQLLVNFF